MQRTPDPPAALGHRIRTDLDDVVDEIRARLEPFTVHECYECGYIEGESPQAGCCPKCGTSSEPIPVRVARV